MTSSAIYVLNDLRDVPANRLHPQKRLRPIVNLLWAYWLNVAFTQVIVVCTVDLVLSARPEV